MAVPEQVRKQTEAVQALYNDISNESGSPENGETPVESLVQEVPLADSVEEPSPGLAEVQDSSGYVQR